MMNKSLSMEIYCDLQVQDNDSALLLKGVYLNIKTNLNAGSPIIIPYTEFEVLYSKARQSSDVPKEDLGIGEIGSIPLEVTNKQNPNYKDVMVFLLEKLNFKTEHVANNDLIVQSDVWTFLELPWEEIGEGKLSVIRKVICKNDKDVEDNNNLLLLMSHAHENVGKDLKEKIVEEIESIYGAMIKHTQTSFRVNSILLSQHTTVESIKLISWNLYNMIHLMMHGDKDGSLCLENPDHQKYKQVDKFSSSDFLSLIKDRCFKLIFLSMCYSGGGIEGKESLAFNIVKSGCSKYVIAYSNAVGEDSARLFADSFYKNLITGNRIEEVYKSSLATYRSTLNNKDYYMPLLYSC